MHQPIHDNSLAELKRIEGELHFERGVLWALSELIKGQSPESISFMATQRIEVLTKLAERLKRRVK